MSYKLKLAYIIIATILICLAGCDFFPGCSAKQEKEIEQAYMEYRKAMQGGDVEGLKQYVSKQKLQELEGPNAQQMLELIKAMYPANITITGINVKGDTATISATAPAEGGSMEGTVSMGKEDGFWKVLQESWSAKISLQESQKETSSQQTPTDKNRPYEYNRIVGTWKGTEAGRPDGEWEFILGSDYSISVKGPHGEAYRGTAYARFDLGEEGGNIRLLYGGAPFDVMITEAQDSNYIGNFSLGSYMLSGDVLKICGSEPGLMKRSSDFMSAGGIRCFELRKS